MNYHNITYPDMNNGDGLRVVLWLSGCTHHCYNCQNPQTWDADSGIQFDELAKEELFRELNKDYISGLTLTGGDPLHEANLNGVLNLVNRIRLLFGDTKTIWTYTGFQWNEIWCNEAGLRADYGLDYCNKISINHKKRQEIVKQCNILVDGRYIDSQRDITLKWVGSSNQRVIAVQESLQKGKIILWQT